MNTALRTVLCGLTICAALRAISVAAEEQRIPANRDNSIVLYPGEEEINAGRQTRIRIKGNQHLVALGFDLAGMRGRIVESAELVCARADEQIAGVTLSTIQAEWDEARSNALTAGLPGVNGWGVAGFHFPAVCDGNSFSLTCHAVSREVDGWYHWALAPDLVHAMASGKAFGLAIHEDSSDYSRNPTIFSREQSGREPYLLLRLGAKGATRPPAPTRLALVQNGDPSSRRLHLLAPPQAFAYHVTILDGARALALPAWDLPYAQPGTMQSIPLRDLDLPVNRDLKVEVLPLNRCGQTGPPARLQIRLTESQLPAMPQIAALSDPGTAPVLRIHPVADRFSPDGQPLGSAPAANEVSPGDGTIRFAAARGETVSVQLLLGGKAPVTVTCKVPGIVTEVAYAVYVTTPAGPLPDPLIVSDTIPLAAEKLTPVVIDFQVPFDCGARKIVGEVQLSDGRHVPVQIAVRPFALPRKASFLCEMNSYGLPPSVAEYNQLQRVALDHRVHANLLHYSHRTAAPGSRQCNLDMLLPNGQRMDEKRYCNIQPGAKQGWWDDFIAAFNPVLTGEVGRDSTRGPVPVPGFYLTFHESWPLHVRQYFNGNPDAYQAFVEHPEYVATFENLVRDFIHVAARQKWHDAGFQIYCNNKGSLQDQTKAPWILDEPTSWWDYRALAFYGDLVRRAKGGKCPVKLSYRIDISRPQFTRGALDGKADLWVVNQESFERYQRLLLDRAERTGEVLWIYGSAAPVAVDSRQIQAWVLQSWRLGATGIVPWQTISRDGKAMQQADDLGLFIFDRQPDGKLIVRPTMRLKVFRRAQQDIEYLLLAQAGAKQTHTAMCTFLENYLNLQQQVSRTSEEDAGTASFRGVSGEEFRRLREAAAVWAAGN
jgi:hypothetical protein